MKNTLVLAALLVAFSFGTHLEAAPSACNAVAGNLVTNCGFETGTLSGWTASPAGYLNQYYGVDTFDANSGTYGAYLAGQSSNFILSQAIATVSGTAYYVTFEVAHPTANIAPYSNDFLASFGATTLLSESNQVFGFTKYTFGGTATSSITTLQFAAMDPLNFFSIDDVAVYVAPEPSTIMLVLPALLFAAFLWKRRSSEVRN